MENIEIDLQLESRLVLPQFFLAPVNFRTFLTGTFLKLSQILHL